jgi:hypothetical protein
MLSPVFSYAIDCTNEYQKHVKTDLNLTYEEFDQTQNSGMRILGNAGCHKETADLIEAYIQKNQARENSLRWHVAQQRAMADDYPLSIISAKQALLAEENFAVRPLRWNDYVLATIAFMEGNKEALVAHRNEVAKGADAYFGNRLNLKLLDVLIANFGKSYSYAAGKL